MTPTEIKKIRKSLGLTQNQLAVACNTHVQTVKKWESTAPGQGRVPSGTAIQMLELMLDLKRIKKWQWFKKKYINEFAK